MFNPFFDPPAYEPFRLSQTFDAHIPMLTLWRKTGVATALPYFTLGRLDYSPSLQVIEVVFGMVAVELHGRHLGSLFGHLCGHQVVSVHEATSAETGLLRETQCVVERVVFRAVGEVQ